MTRFFRFPRFTVFGSLVLGLVLVGLVAIKYAATEENLRTFASQDGKNAFVRQLLALGVNPNAPEPSTGQTAVHKAAEGTLGKPAVKNLQALLQAGGDPNVQDREGNTPLHLASPGFDVFGDHVAPIRVLLQHDADPNLANAQGRTPLHVAEDTPVFRALLEAGADACVQDARGATPYHVSSGMKRIHRALAGAGGDDSSYVGDSGCKWLFDDAPQKADRNKGNEGEEHPSAESAKAKRSSSWPSAVAGLEQQMVTVSGNTQLSKYEVTQALWEAVMGTNPSHFQGCGQCPVEMVSWDDTQVFLQKLNAMTGEAYRLPTEAEWAGALGSGGGAWHWENSGKRTHSVGQQSPNELQLYDMKGNVWEWVEDCWKGDCRRRVVVGGSWFSYPEVLRSAESYGLGTDSRVNVDGLRLARTLD